MAVAIGGRVDDDLQALASGRLAVGAIEGADIGGGGGWRGATFDLAKLGLVIGTEEDVMMVKFKALGSGIR